MANTYTQIYIHYVFAVQNRIGLIQNHWKDELYKYMTGTITNKGNNLLNKYEISTRFWHYCYPFFIDMHALRAKKTI
jgi:hypothetical protein